MSFGCSGGRVRCSQWTREHNLAPIGTAPHLRGVVLVEWPLPWPAKLEQIPELADLADWSTARSIRLQLVVGAGAPSPDRHHVVRYACPPGPPFDGYRRAERVVARTDVVATAMALCEVEDGPDGGELRGGVDVLVCAHGRRDACCGSSGTKLAADLSVLAAGGSLPPGVRIWRTSHLNGHRFAPTVLVLPEGTMWAHADADLVAAVLTGQGDLASALDRYRGCCGLPGPQVQALERLAFAEAGWGWLATARAWAWAAEDEDRVELGTAGAMDSDDGGWWTAQVQPGRRVSVPPCGGVGGAPTSQQEVKVVVERGPRRSPS